MDNNTINRPNKISEEQQNEFYREAAQTFIDEGWVNSDTQMNDIMNDLMWLDLWDSGYEMAKCLERNSFIIYNINSSCVEFLESLDSERDDIIRQNVKEWVKETNPVPVYRVGDCLTLIGAINIELQPSQIVWIHSVREDTAEYVVSKEEKSNGGFIIPYEKVQANARLITTKS